MLSLLAVSKNQIYVSDHLVRLIKAIVHEVRRAEVGRTIEQMRRPRPQPPAYRELTEEDLARAQDQDDLLSGYVAVERSDRFARAAELGRGRCEAGVAAWGLLRCQRSSTPGERWCTQHHPKPSEPVPTERRLHPWDLQMRPDGDLIAAWYRCEDRLQALEEREERVEELLTGMLAQLGRIERQEWADIPKILNAGQAAAYLGVSLRHIYDLCKQRRMPHARMGSLYRFTAAEIDTWLADQMIRPRPQRRSR